MSPSLGVALRRGDGALSEGGSAEALAEIRKPDVALAVWRRSLDPTLLDWIDALPPDLLPHRRFVSPRDMVPEVVAAACAELPRGASHAALVVDIVELIERFSDIMAAPRLRVRLEAIEGDACRRFHQDVVPARLLCTYRGPGTEWGYADPGADPEEIRALSRGDVALCKGSKWPGAAEHRLVHRSPPIAGTGAARLLLAVDPADPLDDEDWATHLRLRRSH